MTTVDREADLSALGCGARVRMSALGLARHPSYGDREGVIIGRGSPSSWRVLFDGRKTPQSIHRDYLDVVAAARRYGSIGAASAGEQRMSS